LTIFCDNIQSKHTVFSLVIQIGIKFIGIVKFLDATVNQHILPIPKYHTENVDIFFVFDMDDSEKHVTDLVNVFD